MHVKEKITVVNKIKTRRLKSRFSKDWHTCCNKT
jgi:hypothetical protein